MVCLNCLELYHQNAMISSCSCSMLALNRLTRHAHVSVCQWLLCMEVACALRVGCDACAQHAFIYTYFIYVVKLFSFCGALLPSGVVCMRVFAQACCRRHP